MRTSPGPGSRGASSTRRRIEASPVPVKRAARMRLLADLHTRPGERRTRRGAHAPEQTVGDRLHVGMAAAVPLRGLAPPLRAAGVDGGVGELATVEAILVQVDHDRVAVLDEGDRAA